MLDKIELKTPYTCLRPLQTLTKAPLLLGFADHYKIIHHHCHATTAVCAVLANSYSGRCCRHCSSRRLITAAAGSCSFPGGHRAGSRALSRSCAAAAPRDFPPHRRCPVPAASASASPAPLRAACWLHRSAPPVAPQPVHHITSSSAHGVNTGRNQVSQDLSAM